MLETATLVLEYIKVLIWPVVLVTVLIFYRDAIAALLPKSKVKINLFGVEIETTLADLEAMTTATLGGPLSEKQGALMQQMAREEVVSYENGIPKADRDWIRPIMNAGLVMTVPAGAHLGEAEGMTLTPLGRLLTRNK